MNSPSTMLRNLRRSGSVGALVAIACFVSDGFATDVEPSKALAEKHVPHPGSAQTGLRETPAMPGESPVGRAHLHSHLHSLDEPDSTQPLFPGRNPGPPLGIASGSALTRTPTVSSGPLLLPLPANAGDEAVGAEFVISTMTVGGDEHINIATDAVPTSAFPEIPEVPPFGDPPGFSDYLGPQCNGPYAPFVSYDPSVPEAEEPFSRHLTEGFLEALTRPVEPMAEMFATLLGTEHDHPETELDWHPIGIQPIPPRPPLILELNEEFLAPGFLDQGIRLPTGAVWRPSLWVFGTLRTGVNYFESGAGSQVSEWANRLDLFSQLNLSGTERVLFGLRPLDEEERTSRDFTSYDFANGDWRDGWDASVQTLFFEGDFGEVFPFLDPDDTRALDYGFSVGRQPMLFQQGLLLNEDRIDALTVTRNTLNGIGILNLRATAVYAWDQINRHNLTGGNVRDPGSQMVGLFTESDTRVSTINVDGAYVWSEDGVNDMAVFGISSIRRFQGYRNTYNSSLHLLASFPTNGETNLAGQGELVFSQFSWTPHRTEDLIFLNTFWAIDQFTSASRGPLAGGPLGQTGLLFSAAGLGRYGAPLDNQASNVVGGSLGYQMFFDHTRQQVVFEIGGRQDTDGVDQAAVGSGIRYQRALNQHWLVIVDGFVTKRESRHVGQGARVEFQMKF